VLLYFSNFLLLFACNDVKNNSSTFTCNEVKFLAIFSTFTSLLCWQSSCVTSKSNYTVILINASFTTVSRKPTARQLVTLTRQLDDIRWGIHAAAASAFHSPHLQMPACSLVTGGQLQIRKQVSRSKRTAKLLMETSI